MRAVAPWDVALTDPAAGTPAGDRRAEFDRWVAGAAAVGARPLVTFEQSLDPARPGAPSLDDYTAALRAFAATYPSVRDVAPWNEPNFRDPAVNPYPLDPFTPTGMTKSINGLECVEYTYSPRPDATRAPFSVYAVSA